MIKWCHSDSDYDVIYTFILLSNKAVQSVHCNPQGHRQGYMQGCNQGLKMSEVCVCVCVCVNGAVCVCLCVWMCVVVCVGLCRCEITITEVNQTAVSWQVWAALKAARIYGGKGRWLPFVF